MPNSSLAIISGHTQVPPLNNGAMTAPALVMLAVIAFKQPSIECLTLGLSRELDVTLSDCYSGDYPTQE